MDRAATSPTPRRADYGARIADRRRCRGPGWYRFRITTINADDNSIINHPTHHSSAAAVNPGCDHAHCHDRQHADFDTDPVANIDFSCHTNRHTNVDSDTAGYVNTDLYRYAASNRHFHSTAAAASTDAQSDQCPPATATKHAGATATKHAGATATGHASGDQARTVTHVR